jgi:hypothetical protein
MPSPRTSDALLAPETQKALSLPVATLILGAVSQVDSLIELADRVVRFGILPAHQDDS